MSDIPLHRLERARRNLPYLSDGHCCDPDGNCNADDWVDTPYPEDQETIRQLLDDAIEEARRYQERAAANQRHLQEHRA